MKCALLRIELSCSTIKASLTTKVFYRSIHCAVLTSNNLIILCLSSFILYNYKAVASISVFAKFEYFLLV